MSTAKKIETYGLEQARMQLPAIAANAHTGISTLITKHGKPYAAVVPVAQLQSRPVSKGVLALQGTGRGLWGADSRQAVADLRAEWDERGTT